MEGIFYNNNNARYWRNNSNYYAQKNTTSNNLPNIQNKNIERHQNNINDPVEHNINQMLKNHHIVTGIGVSIISAGLILASRGKVSKNLTSWMTKGVNKIANITENLKKSNHLSKMEMLYLHGLQKTTNFLKMARGTILQITPLKDVLFAKALNKLKLGKFGNKITNFFENTAIRMTNNSYQKSSDAFAIMMDCFNEINKSILKGADKEIVINGVSKTTKEWAKIAQQKSKKINSKYDFFRHDAVRTRQKSLMDSMTGLGDKIFDMTYGDYKGFFLQPKKWTTFISEDLVSSIKMNFKKNVLGNKKTITNTFSDFSKDVGKTIDSMEATIDMTHKDSVDIIKRTKKIISTYKKVMHSGKSKNDVIKQLDDVIKDSSTVFSDKNSQYTTSASKKLQESLQYIKNAMQEDKPGEVEEILNIYKNILSPEDFAKIKSIVNKSKSALNDAVGMETERFVDKVRDLKAGSALTDVANGLLVPSVSTGIGIASADTKEKKRSVALKLGIPLLVGVGVSTIGTVALLSAGPSMALGLTTSFITSRVCSRIDKYLKERDSQKNNNTKNSKV